MRGGDSFTSERLPDDVVDAAITWLIKLHYNHATPQTQAAFERWLHADPLHAQAWRRVTSIRSDFAKVPPTLALETLQAVESKRQAHRLSRRSAMKLLSLSGIVMGLGWVARDNVPWQRLLADASTAIGEQKTLRMADGTVIVLNTDSAVSADMVGAQRLVTLWRGEILVNTGVDAAMPDERPFWVYNPFGKVQAFGTRFVVRVNQERARISVQEGAVELHPTDGSRSAVVRSGESRWLADNGTVPAESLGFEDDAFADGVITGKDIRLGDLVAELSRYRQGHISCDERVADLRVSGVFHIKDTDQALQFLAQTQPINIAYHTRFWVAVEPSQSS